MAEVVECRGGSRLRSSGGSPGFCEQCGAKLIADSKFCGQCGTPVLVAVSDPAGESEPDLRRSEPDTSSETDSLPTNGGDEKSTLSYIGEATILACAAFAIIGLPLLLLSPTEGSSTSVSEASEGPRAGVSVPETTLCSDDRTLQALRRQVLQGDPIFIALYLGSLGNLLAAANPFVAMNLLQHPDSYLRKGAQAILNDEDGGLLEVTQISTFGGDRSAACDATVTLAVRPPAGVDGMFWAAARENVVRVSYLVTSHDDRSGVWVEVPLQECHGTGCDALTIEQRLRLADLKRFFVTMKTVEEASSKLSELSESGGETPSAPLGDDTSAANGVPWDAIQSKWSEANKLDVVCRSGSDAEATWSACAERDRIDMDLRRSGWCASRVEGDAPKVMRCNE